MSTDGVALTDEERATVVASHAIGFRTLTLAVCSCGQWSWIGKYRECHARWRTHFAEVILSSLAARVARGDQP